MGGGVREAGRPAGVGGQGRVQIRRVVQVLPRARDLLAVRFRDGQYTVEILDHDVGPANAVSFELDGQIRILAANREINEVAYYTVTG